MSGKNIPSESTSTDGEAEIIRDQISRINNLIHKSNYESAIEICISAYERALALDRPFIIAEILSLFGVIENAKGHIKKAMNYMSKAFSMAKESGNIPIAVKALNGIAGIYGLFGEYRSAITAYTELLNLIETFPEVQMKRISAFNNLGLIFQQLEDYDTAEKYYLDGLSLSKNLYQDADQDKTIVAILYSNLSELYFFKKDFQKSRLYLDQSLEISQATDDFIGLATCRYLEALLSYELEQDWSKAFSLFTDAVVIMEKYGADYELNELKISFGKLAYKANAIKIAQSLLVEALDHAREYGYVQMEPTICALLEQIHLKDKNYLGAYEMSHRQLELKKAFAEQWDMVAVRNITEELRNDVESRQVNELKRTIQTMKLLSEVGRAVTSTLDIRDIFEVLGNSLAKILELSSFAIGLYEMNTDQIYNHVYDDGVYRDQLIDLSNENSFMAWCIRSRKEIVIFNSKDRAYNSSILTAQLAGILDKTGLKSILFCPMTSGDDIIGGVTFQSSVGLSFVDLEALRLLTSYISIAIINIRKSQTLLEANRKLEMASRIDSLTSLLNRRALGVYITQTLEKDIAKLLPVTIIMIDLDYFKQYNDHYGHSRGDMCLISVSKTIQHVLIQHTSNFGAYRFGGDEFLLIIEHCDRQTCRTIIDDLTGRISALKLEHSRSKVNPYVTLTIGACVATRTFSDYTEAFTVADEALYVAKGNGRNTSIILDLK